VKPAVALLALLSGVSLARADGAGWDVRVPDKLEVAIGGTAQLKLDIAVDRGFVVSKDGPVLIDVAPDPGLYVKKRRLARTDAVDPEADVPRFVIPVRGDGAGEHPVKLRIRLWLCGGKVCRPVDQTRTTTITVVPARPESPPG
jgi:hypothetical protein